MSGQAIPTELWGLILGPYGAVVILAVIAWKMWTVLTEHRAHARADNERMIVALQANTAALIECRAVTERVEKLLERGRQ